MPGHRSILASAICTLVLIAALSAQSMHNVRAEDECLAKPNAPAPQGQHWYYRTDHANNKRQCWYLREEGLPVKKSASRPETSEPDAAVQSAAPVPAQQPVTAPAAAPAESETQTGAAATAAPVRWLDVVKMPDVPAIVQPAPAEQTRPESATGAAPTANSRASASASEPSPPASDRAEQPQRRTAAQPSPSTAPAKTIAEMDHTFALLMIMFAVLAVTGPVIHFTQRRRQRETRIFQIPPWARVTALNAPTPRIRVPLADTPTPRVRAPLAPAAALARRPAPVPQRPASVPQRFAPVSQRSAPMQPPRPSDQTERLAQALQKLVAELQTSQRAEPGSATRLAQRTGIELMRSTHERAESRATW